MKSYQHFPLQNACRLTQDFFLIKILIENVSDRQKCVRIEDLK